MRAATYALTIVLASAGCGSASAADRWYDDGQVARGETVYRDNCLECHLEGGTGSDDWRQRDAEGRFPPPPLNGTAHTWHHDLEVLARTIREGGEKLGGYMPGFGDVLDEAEIAAVIAYVQSLWPDDIYATWAKSYPEDAAGGLTVPARANADEGDPTANDAITAQLAALVADGIDIGEPEPTPIDGIYAVSAGPRILYLDESGRYALVGKLMDLQTREDLTEQRLGARRLEQLAAFPDDDKVVFRAEGEEKAHVDVFTDTTCPFCQRLHNEVPKLQEAGVTVRYLPFPRSGPRGAGYEEMRSVWCSANRQQAMTDAKSGQSYRIGDTACEAADAVAEGYRLGIEVGVTGTPSIVLPDGRMLPGYQPWRDLLSALRVTP